MNLSVLGVIENMSGFACPRCSKRIDIFAGNGGREIARDFKVSLLGKIQMDPTLVRACDLGRPFVDTADQNLTADPNGSNRYLSSQCYAKRKSRQ